MGESQEKKREGKDEESKDRRGWNLAENAVRKGKKNYTIIIIIVMETWVKEEGLS